MQRQESEEIQKDSVVRVLSPGFVYIHNNHLQSGLRTARSCGLCAAGLAVAYETVAQEKPVDSTDGVSESDGADKEGDAAHSRDYGDFTSGDGS